MSEARRCSQSRPRGRGEGGCEGRGGGEGGRGWACGGEGGIGG